MRVDCVFLSFVLYVPQAARVHLTELVVTPQRVIRERLADDIPCPRIRIFSLEGEFFFGASPELESHLEAIEEAANHECRVVVLRLKRVRNPDAVCMSVLDRFIDRLQQPMSRFCYAARPDMKVIDSSGLVRLLGPDRVFVFQESGKF